MPVRTRSGPTRASPTRSRWTVDEFGNVLTLAPRSATAAGRPIPALSSERPGTRRPNARSPAARTRLHQPRRPGRTPTGRRCRAKAARYELAGPGSSRPGRRGSASTRCSTAVATATPSPTRSRSPRAGRQKRLIEHVRIRYRPDDLGAGARATRSTLLPLGALESLALSRRELPARPHPGLDRPASTPAQGRRQRCCETEAGPTCTARATRTGGCRSGRVLPVARTHPARTTRRPSWRTPAEHFFLPAPLPRSVPPRRIRHRERGAPTTPTTCWIVRDPRTRWASVTTATYDYRVLQPRLVTDPNGNRSEVAFDALGMVVGTAVMGKDGRDQGRLAARLRARPGRGHVARAPRRSAGRSARHPAAGDAPGWCTTCSRYLRTREQAAAAAGRGRTRWPARPTTPISDRRRADPRSSTRFSLLRRLRPGDPAQDRRRPGPCSRAERR